jgi:hypothetical protein
MGKTGAAPTEHKEHREIQAPKRATATATGGCIAKGCRHHEDRFGFCTEHYDQFKFGLIKRTGEAVPDYEKKFEHYQAFRARQRAHQVA